MTGAKSGLLRDQPAQVVVTSGGETTGILDGHFIHLEGLMDTVQVARKVAEGAKAMFEDQLFGSRDCSEPVTAATANG